jgi:hypothetical protein
LFFFCQGIAGDTMHMARLAHSSLDSYALSKVSLWLSSLSSKWNDGIDEPLMDADDVKETMVELFSKKRVLKDGSEVRWCSLPSFIVLPSCVLVYAYKLVYAYVLVYAFSLLHLTATNGILLHSRK